MKVHVTQPPESRGIERVARALIRFVPSHLNLVSDWRNADLVVLHVIGRQDAVYRQAERLRMHGKRYAVIQYCVRSTMRPNTSGWVELWENAALVWSYYDLPALCAADGTIADFPFYHAPLGADAAVFRIMNRETRPLIIATSGLSWLSESVKEATRAAWAMGRRTFHIGPNLKRSGIFYSDGIDDRALAMALNRCEFVAGLRRTEGFELPAVEGLLCGARPICFDRPHYRQWYEPWAVFIPEGSREEVFSALVSVFEGRARSVSNGERRHAAAFFDWRVIVRGFWDQVG